MEFVLTVITGEERFQLSQLRKQMVKYTEAFAKPVAYGFESITTFQRKSLIEHRLSFVSANGQIFLPFIGTFFGRCISNKISTDILRFSPATQMLFLLLLYASDNLMLNRSQAAQILKLTPMSVSRAVRQLNQTGVIEEIKSGVEVKIHRILSKAEAYETVKPYLLNPVQKTVYVLAEDVPADLPVAGEQALSDRSELGYPSFEEYALSKESVLTYGFRECDPQLNPDMELVKVQIWKYDPTIFMTDNAVDPVSLICSFEDEKDERIHKCLDDISKKIKEWQTGI